MLYFNVSNDDDSNVTSSTDSEQLDGDDKKVCVIK